jgi:outer membrane protein assembly factor BamD (BamD/ComL family)
MSQAFLKVRACNDAGTALKALLKNHPQSPLYRQAQKELRKVKSLGPAQCDDR